MNIVMMNHELFLTTRQKSRIRNAFANYMSTELKISKVQLPKTVQSGGFFGNVIDNLSRKALSNFALPLTKDVFPKWATQVALSAKHKLERKISGRRPVRAGMDSIYLV